MEVEPRPRPRPGEGEAVVGVAAAGICGSELGSFTGDSARRPPGRVFGHELAGTVRAVGPGVSGDLEGRLVAVNPLVACGRCPNCQAGRSNVCPNRTLLGLHLDGGFAEEVAVAAANLSALDALDPLGGTFVEPYANAVHVVELLPSVIGRHVAVYGAGPIGLSVVALLRIAGVARVTAIDPVAARREMALRAGAHEALDPVAAGSAPLAADHVVDAAGTTGSRSAAVGACQPGGAVVLLGLHSATSDLAVNEAIAKELHRSVLRLYAA